MDILKYLDPLRYVSAEKYASFWYILMHTVLSGIGARIFSVLSFILAFWSLVRRENVSAFMVFLIASLFFAYAGGILTAVF